MAEKEIRTFSLTEIRAIDGAKPVIEGHAAVFNQKSHDMGFREIIMPGAFAEAVMTDDVKFLLNHRGLPLARTKSGTLRLSEDEKGLAFRAELDSEDPDVKRLMPKVKRGDLSEMSFAFSIKDENKDERWTLENGQMLRSLLKVRLHDVSAVNEPAYPGTNLQQSRSYYEKRMAEAAGAPPPPADDEKVKAEFLERNKARTEFISSRIPAPDPLSFSEILKNARVKT